MKTKVFFALAVVSFCAAPCVIPAQAHKASQKADLQTSSSLEELAALKARPLPALNTLKVAILPFSDYASTPEHIHIATAANWAIWTREGFQVAPLLSGFDALARDKKIEPGLSLRLDDAVRIGEALGVDWVVYGEVKELRPYKKDSLFKSGKYLMAGMRIAVADVKRGELVYWQMRSERVGGSGYFGGFQSSVAQQKRIGVMTVSSRSAQPLFDVFPAHTVVGKLPDSGGLAKIVDEAWPDKK